ncbi:glycosyltransferase family A protein [Sphingomonas solaris]|uniref:glycosyltransferase family A protein n=1 Tax=Alterirhizorhabdus solaris TaxID=2529389 RepID=UPI001396BA0E|nr:glycosyltransferase family A protein [Sphingomonas solaris]
MTPPPRFAVVIPLHNKGSEIGAALASVLAQTLPADEIVVVDDASTDDGPAIVAACADPRLLLLRRAVPGAGGYAARNAAAAAASAQWIAFLDGDDLWHPDHLAALASLAARFPAAGCLATRYTHRFHDRTEPDTAAGRFAGTQAFLTDLDGFLDGWLAAGHCPMWTGAVAIRRDLLLATGGFPAGRAARGGDKDMWLRAVAGGGLAFLPRSTADFRREAADKLTDRTGTRHLPCLVVTVRALARGAAPGGRRRLRRLANQEIMLYARWTMPGEGRPAFGVRDLLWPAPPSAIATLLASIYLPKALLRALRRRGHQRRDRLAGRGG